MQRFGHRRFYLRRCRQRDQVNEIDAVGKRGRGLGSLGLQKVPGRGQGQACLAHTTEAGKRDQAAGALGQPTFYECAFLFAADKGSQIHWQILQAEVRP